MKICPYCGSQELDDNKFCRSCGASFVDENLARKAALQGQVVEETVVRVSEAEEKPAEKPKKSAGQKIKVIAILVVILAVLGAAAYFGLSYYFSPEQRLQRALDSGDMSVAAAIIKEDISLRRSNELLQDLKSRISKLEAEFIDGTVSFEAAIQKLTDIEALEVKDLTEEISVTRGRIEKLNASRKIYAEGDALLEAGDYLSAIVCYEQVIEADGNYAAALNKITQAVSSYRSLMLDKAAEYVDAGDYDGAITVLNSALKDLPDDEKLTQQITAYQTIKADQLLAEALSKAAQYADAEDYASAIIVLEQYAKDNGENVDVSVALNSYKTSYSEQIMQKTLDTAAAYAQIGDYVSAIKTLNTYTEDYGTNASVVIALNEYTESYVDAVVADAEALVNEGDYPGAITALRSAQANAAGNTRLDARLNTYISAYETEIITQSDLLLESEDYDGAQGLVDQGMQIVTDSQLLKAQSEKIAAKRVRKFMDVCTPYETRYYGSYVNGRTFNMSGEAYTDGFVFDYTDSSYAYFNVGGKYTKLEFDFGHVDGSSTNNANINVYLDGELSYTIKASATDMPQHFVLDITGVKQIRFVSASGSTTYKSKYGFANMEIS